MLILIWFFVESFNDLQILLMLFLNNTINFYDIYELLVTLNPGGPWFDAYVYGNK